MKFKVKVNITYIEDIEVEATNIKEANKQAVSKVMKKYEKLTPGKSFLVESDVAIKLKKRILKLEKNLKSSLYK